MANIISVGTALPKFRHQQSDILKFMQHAYALNDTDKRKLAYLYHQSSINTRYSVVEDFGNTNAVRALIPADLSQPSPNINRRMELYEQEALPLTLEAIAACIDGFIEASAITHLITISCTGMSAPGLDLQVCEAMGLPPTIFRTSVNFMGCYAAIHGLKLAKMICDTTPGANVVLVTTELCTLHFQQEFTLDNAASSLLFADGSAAVLVSSHSFGSKPLKLQSFYSQVSLKGKNDMAWQINSKGFLMTLSSYIPQLIQQDIAGLVQNAFKQAGISAADVSHWCIHPGGKKIIDVIQQQMNLCDCQVAFSRKVLSDYGNMSSASVLFVLKSMMQQMNGTPANVFGIAFGPGLTMETFIASR